MSRGVTRPAVAAAALAAAVAGMLPTVWAAPAAEAAGAVHATALGVQETWAVALPDGGYPVLGSSPVVATLDGGGPSAVVGDRSGRVWAYHLSDGSSVAGWPKSTSAPIQSSPSTVGSSVFVGLGDAAAPFNGGYEFITPSGSTLHTVGALPSPGNNSAVMAGLAVGNLQGQTDVVGSSLGQMADGFTATGAPLSGFPYFQGDTNTGTMALADMYQNGQTDIVEGGASTAGLAYGVQYRNGGHIRVFGPTGNLICNYWTGQPVFSSPAVGEFLSSHRVGIVAGTASSNFAGGANLDQVLATDAHCNLQWATTLDGITDASPAIVNALGNGQLQIAMTTHNSANNAGSVYLLNGDGSVVWRVAAPGGASGSPVSIDLGGGYQDIVVTGTQGLEILDGRSGAVVWSQSLGTQNLPASVNSALVTDDPNGTVGITVAGYTIVGYHGEIVHFEIAGSDGSRVTEAGSWPEFHHDPQLTGDAGTPAPQVRVNCSPPRSPAGYYVTASDGGTYNFGNLPFCGSTGQLVLSKPIVGMAVTPDGGGYWLVASDGGIFNFGDAGFYGSAGNLPLTKPIVAIASTADGRGYWLVASDGGIFNYGDARFHGSAGNLPLVKPIVGMATTPDGGGYWLVASDGGIFNYGTAGFHGSAGNLRLVKPIVAMSSTADGRGYWMVASDGGIFNYGTAGFHGSAGNLRLVKPIVSMATTSDGGGYWLVASDGGIFNYGDAPMQGSAAADHLSNPVVAMAVP